MLSLMDWLDIHLVSSGFSVIHKISISTVRSSNSAAINSTASPPRSCWSDPPPPHQGFTSGCIFGSFNSSTRCLNKIAYNSLLLLGDAITRARREFWRREHASMVRVLEFREKYSLAPPPPAALLPERTVMFNFLFCSKFGVVSNKCLTYLNSIIF